MKNTELPKGVSIILYRSGRFAVSQRIGITGNPGLWQFAAGHVEEGEQPLDAAIRELREEAGLVVPSHRFQFLGTTGPLTGYKGEQYVGYRFGVMLRFSEEPRRMEPEKAADWEWVSPDKLLTLPMLQATKEYAMFFAYMDAACVSP
jgi:8-oxo-dGTP diphosphatase